jgi:hypothetical protein
MRGFGELLIFGIHLFLMDLTQFAAADDEIKIEEILIKSSPSGGEGFLLSLLHSDFASPLSFSRYL